MKKLFFSLVMLVTLVIVAGSAKGQDATHPYLDATYSYSISGISPASNNRVEVYFTSDQGGSTLIDPATSYTLTSPIGADLKIATAGNKFYSSTLSAGTLSFDLNLSSGTSSAFKSADGATKFFLWIKVFTGDNNTCSNYKYLEITPKVNNFRLDIASTGGGCQSTISPATENTMATQGQTNSFSYTITPTGVGNGQNWQFTLTLDKTKWSYLGADNIVNYVTATVSGSGAITPTSAYSNGVITLTAPSTATAVTVSFSISSTPGADNTDFKATLSDEKLLNNAANKTLFTADPTNDNATVTFDKIPYIGDFMGVN